MSSQHGIHVCALSWSFFWFHPGFRCGGIWHLLGLQEGLGTHYLKGMTIFPGIPQAEETRGRSLLVLHARLTMRTEDPLYSPPTPTNFWSQH